MRTKAFLASLLVLLTWPALAETAPPARPPVVEVPCDGFVRNADGSWTPTRDVNVPTHGGVLTVGTAVSFKPGVSSPGLDFDLAEVLERQCAAK